VLVVVVVLVVILALFATGVFNSTNASSTTPTFRGISGAANRTAGQVSGGPWDLVAVLGFDTSTGTTVPVGSSVGANCTLVSAGSGPTPTSVYVPAYHGTFASGESPWWGMIYDQRSTHQILLVQALNGTVEALAVGSGLCGATFQNFTTVPSNAVDSSAAASAAWGQGGSVFASAHPSLDLSMEMALIGGGTFQGIPVGTVWAIDINPCGALGSGGPTGSQPDFEAIVDAETGVVTLATATTTVCGTAPVLT
jgi:hypothetical protein